MDLRQKLAKLIHKYQGSNPPTKLFLAIPILVIGATLLIVYLGSLVGALENLGKALFAVKGVLLYLEALQGKTRISLVIGIGISFIIFYAAVEKFAKNSKARVSLIICAIIISFSAVVILLSVRPGTEGISITPRIAVAFYQSPTEQITRKDLIIEAVSRAERTIREFNSEQRWTARGTERMALKVEAIHLKNPANAIEQIVDELKSKGFGYLILTVHPRELNYRKLINRLKDEVITFVVLPSALTDADKPGLVAIYPPPKREGEWMAQHLLRLGARDIVIIYREGLTSFEGHCKSSFVNVLYGHSKVEPAQIISYSSVKELSQHIKILCNRDTTPDAIYIIDTSHAQVHAVSSLAERDYRGYVALTSRVLDYFDPKNERTLDLNITLPWPIERYLSHKLQLREELSLTPEPEKETTTGASVYSAIVLADYAHQEVKYLEPRQIEEYIFSLPQDLGIKKLLPLGAIRFSRSKIAPHTDIMLKMFRRTN